MLDHLRPVSLSQLATFTMTTDAKPAETYWMMMIVSAWMETATMEPVDPNLDVSCRR